MNVQSYMCPYKGKPRPVHPAVCEWHIRERDPECLKQDCAVYKEGVAKDGGNKTTGSDAGNR